MSDGDSDQDITNKEALNFYYDGFKHISTLSIATALLTAALFRDSGPSNALSPFIILGVTLAISLFGMLRIATLYEQGNIAPARVGSLFFITVVLFIGGIGNIAFAPLVLIIEGTRFSPLIITISRITLVILFVALIYLSIRLYKLYRRGIELFEERQQLFEERRQLIEQLKQEGFSAENIKSETGLDVDSDL